MNPALLKALIISGGTIGLGVPGIYYGYPYISNLVSPGAEEDQKSPTGQTRGTTEGSQSVKLVQKDQAPTDQTSQDDKSTNGKNDESQTSNGDNGDSITGNESGKAGNKNLNTHMGTGETNDGRGEVGNGTRGPGSLPAPGTLAQATTGQDSGSQGNQ